MTAYYNEIDHYAAQWLRNLIAAGHIAPGEVDERSIVDVKADDLRGFTQCHFFAGIGGWSYALRLAGWPDDRPVWTGSCPCQPFSAAGRGEGATDPRHLWPAWFRLIQQRRPVVVFGEQVGAAIRHGWLDLVSSDLEGLDYAVGAAVVGAHSVGAPHIRQRLFFVAHAAGGRYCEHERNTGSMGISSAGGQSGKQKSRRFTQAPGNCSEVGRLADAHEGQRGRLADGKGREFDGQAAGRIEGDGIAQSGSTDCGMGITPSVGCERQRHQPAYVQPLQTDTVHGWNGTNDWLACLDGKARRTQSGLFPLAHGVSNRVGRLRAYGNAIVPQVAAEFIEAYQRRAMLTASAPKATAPAAASVTAELSSHE